MVAWQLPPDLRGGPDATGLPPSVPPWKLAEVEDFARDRPSQALLAADDALREGQRRPSRRLVLTALAAVLAFLALVFLLLAAFLWLSARLPQLEAALILSGALALPAALLLKLARSGNLRPVKGRLRSEVARLYGSACDEVRERPAMPLMGAGLAGVVLGLLLMDRR